MASECLKTLLKQGATRPFRSVTVSADTLFQIRDEHNDELTRLRAELERKDQELKKFNDYVGSNMIRSDFRTVDDIRAELERCREAGRDLYECEKVLKQNEKTIDALRAQVGQVESNALREAVAAVMHDVWAHWMKYLFSRCKRLHGEDLRVIPNHQRLAWKRQMNTPYNKLTEDEKDSDRDQAEKVLAVVKAALCGEVPK